MTIEKIRSLIKDHITERIWELADQIDPSSFVDDEDIMTAICEKVNDEIDMDELIAEAVEEEL